MRLKILAKSFSVCGSALQLELDGGVEMGVVTVMDFLNSSFVSASVSALAGAAFGAWGAGLATARAARKKELGDALRQANAAVVLGMTALDAIYSLKKQHVVPLFDEFELSRRELEAHLYERSHSGQQVKVKFNMLHLSPLKLPIDGLNGLVMAGQMMPGRALALTAMLEQTLVEHQVALEHRYRVIEELRSSSAGLEEKMRIYFGFPDKEGGSNLMFKTSMEALKLYTDDLAFFVVELVEDLLEHAANVAAKLRKIDRSAPRALAADLSLLKESGLIPSKENYESWLSGYPTTRNPAAAS